MIPTSVSLPASAARQRVIYTSLGRSIQLHVQHPDVIDPLTSLGDRVISPLTHVLLHYQGRLFTYYYFTAYTVCSLYCETLLPIVDCSSCPNSIDTEYFIRIGPRLLSYPTYKQSDR